MSVEEVARTASRHGRVGGREVHESSAEVIDRVVSTTSVGSTSAGTPQERGTP
jgi:hypothetical protein